MAVQERLEALLREGQRDSMEGTASSRLDKELEDIPGEALPPLNGSLATSSVTAPEWLGALEVAGLITVLTESLPRLKTNKVNMFLSPLARLLPEAARVLVKRVPAIVSQDAQQANMTSRPQVAVQVVQALMKFIHVALQWVRAREGAAQDDTPDDLVAVLLVSFASLASSLPPIAESADSQRPLSEQYFLQKNPRYRIDGASSSQGATAPSPTHGEAIQSPVSYTVNHSHDIWTTLRKTCDALHVDLLEVAFAKRLPRTASGREANSARGGDSEGQESIRRQEDHASTMDVTSQLGAFLLYVKLQARTRLNVASASGGPQASGDQSPLWSQEEALSLLADSLGLLAAGLGANPPTTSSSSVSQASGGTEGQLPDCALLYTMWCLECVPPGAAVEEKVLLSLVQLLSTHAALSPLPSSRHIAFTLLRALLLEHTLDRETQLDLFRDLIAASPFPQLKSASVAILRELVQSGGEDKTSERQLGELQDLVFVVPAPVPLPAGEERLGAEGAEASSSDTASASASLPASEDLSKAKTYLEEQGPWLIEGLNLLFLVLSRSQGQSQTQKVREASSFEATVSSALRLESVQTDFLEPIRRFLHAWRTSEGAATRPAAVLGGQPIASPAQTGVDVRSVPGSASGSEVGTSPAQDKTADAPASTPAAAAAASAALPRVSTSSSSSAGQSASLSYSHSHSHSQAGSHSSRSVRATLEMHIELLQVALSRVEEVWPAAVAVDPSSGAEVES